MPDPKLTPGENPAVEAADAPIRPQKAPGESVAELFREHNGSLLRYLTARLRSPQEAKEVAQEAFEQILGLHDPDTVNLLHHYLFKTAANLATNRLKQRTTRRRLDERNIYDTEESRSPERTVAAKQEIALLRHAIGQLDRQTRDAFVLVRLQGLTSADAARLIGLTPQTVRKYVAHALTYCHDVVHGKGLKQGGPK